MVFSCFVKKVAFVFFIILLSNYCYASEQAGGVETLKVGSLMFLSKEYKNFKAGQNVTFFDDMGDGRYLTSLGPIDSSLLETKLERAQRLQHDAERTEFDLVLNNAEDCKIEFLTPHENLSYVDNISLKRGDYNVRVSKYLHIPVTLNIPMNKDVTYDVELKSIFTNYGGGYIDELIKSGEMKLDEEFDGKTLLHQLIDNFSQEYPSFSRIGGAYEGLPKDAPIDDFLTAIQYFINSGFDINKPDDEGKNLLSNVIKRGPTEVITRLLQSGAKIQPEFMNADNDYAGIFPKVGFRPGEKWNEKVLYLLPEDLLTELLDLEVDGFFPADDHRFIKLLLEGGAYPFEAFTRSDKQIKDKISGRIMFNVGEEQSHGYLKWATENYDKIKVWKEKQQISFKLNGGDFAEIKDYTDNHPDSLQYITDEKLKVSLVGPKELTIKKITELIVQGVKDEELTSLIDSTDEKYATSFTDGQKQYMLDAGLSINLINYLELHSLEVEIKREREERLARLERERLERERLEKEREEIARNEIAREEAQREAQNKKRSKRELFGKIAAIGMGAAIANSSSLDSAAKTEFMTSYATDVLNNDGSLSNTEQWKNKTIQQNQQINSTYQDPQNNYSQRLEQIRAQKKSVMGQEVATRQGKPQREYDRQQAQEITCYTTAEFSPGRYNIGDSGFAIQGSDSTVRAIASFITGSSDYPYKQEHVVFGFKTNVPGSCAFMSVDESLMFIKKEFKNAEGFRHWNVRQ